MRAVARSRNVELYLLDHTKPLLDQGEYDAIVHKLRPNKDWERNLQEYIKARPGVKVIDSLAGIRIVHNRATMLLPLREHPEGIIFQRPGGVRNGTSSGLGGCSCARVQSPTQVEILEGTTLGEAESLLRSAGLVPPLLVKPLWTDGREGSHGLAVLHDMGSLGLVLQGGLSAELKPPLVVQQFVEHGGVLFKVYVLGSRTVVCRRPSLGDFYLSEEARAAGVLSLPRISCKSSYGANGAARAAAARPPPPAAALGVSCDSIAAAAAPGQQQQPAAPPEWVTAALAGTLRDKLGLQLFNFDMICPEEQSTSGERLYYVVDINYFPGVDKIPDFERIFVDFLTSACEADGDGSGGGRREGVATSSELTTDVEAEAERLAPAGPDAAADDHEMPHASVDTDPVVTCGQLPHRYHQHQQPWLTGDAAAVPMDAEGEEAAGDAGGCGGGRGGVGRGGDDGLSSVPSARGELDWVSGAEAPSAPSGSGASGEVTSGARPPQYDWRS